MQRRVDSGFDDDQVEIGPSKTQRKKAMLDLQDVGEALLKLPDELLDGIEMETELRDAIRALRGVHSHEARRRLSQYVGKLIRVADPEPLHRALAAYRRVDAQALQQTEAWLERLLTDDAAVTAWITDHPEETQPLRTLIRNARREIAAASAAAAANPAVAPRGKGRFTRELFQRLRATLSQV